MESESFVISGMYSNDISSRIDEIRGGDMVSISIGNRLEKLELQAYFAQLMYGPNIRNYTDGAPVWKITWSSNGR